MTVVLVTHLMDDVADFADFVYVLERGRIVKSGSPKEVFQDVDFMDRVQLGVPKATRFARDLVDRGLQLEQLPITIEELGECLYG